VIDNVTLAVFVDAGASELLLSLAGGSLLITPSILDPLEQPPFTAQPTAEFARGLFTASGQIADAFQAGRAQRRTAFYARQNSAWQSASPSLAELKLAAFLVSKHARVDAQLVLAARGEVLKAKRIDAGEAECAAVAVTRGLTLWSDDSGMVAIMRALYPTHPVERTCALLVRAVREGLMSCADAAHLYNVVFKVNLHLFSNLSISCQHEIAVCQ
jgi:hypothetical protein